MELTDKRQELQRVLMELETYRKHMESLRREIQLLDANMSELRSSLTALDSLKETKEGTQILVSIGSGSFITARVGDTQKVIVGVGAGVSVEKRADDAKKILEARGEEIAKTVEKLQRTAMEINDKLVKLGAESERLAGEIQEEPR